MKKITSTLEGKSFEIDEAFLKQSGLEPVIDQFMKTEKMIVEILKHSINMDVIANQAHDDKLILLIRNLISAEDAVISCKQSDLQTRKNLIDFLGGVVFRGLMGYMVANKFFEKGYYGVMLELSFFITREEIRSKSSEIMDLYWAANKGPINATIELTLHASNTKVNLKISDYEDVDFAYALLIRSSLHISLNDFTALKISHKHIVDEKVNYVKDQIVSIMYLANKYIMRHPEFKDSLRTFFDAALK